MAEGTDGRNLDTPGTSWGSEKSPKKGAMGSSGGMSLPVCDLPTRILPNSCQHRSMSKKQQHHGHHYTKPLQCILARKPIAQTHTVDTFRVLRSGGQNSKNATRTPLGDDAQPRRGTGFSEGEELFDGGGAEVLLASPETSFLNLSHVGNKHAKTQVKSAGTYV